MFGIVVITITLIVCENKTQKVRIQRNTRYVVFLNATKGSVITVGFIIKIALCYFAGFFGLFSMNSEITGIYFTKT